LKSLPLVAASAAALTSYAYNIVEHGAWSNLEVDEKAVEFFLAGAAVKVLTTRLQQDTDQSDSQ